MNPIYRKPKNFRFCLAHLVEECGEVLAAAGKTLRWGAQSWNPELPSAERETNINWLSRELADLKSAIEIIEPLIKREQRK